MDLNQLIQKIPRPILVVSVIAISLVIFVVNDPLKDECQIQSELFMKKTRGLITPVRLKSGKVQYPQIVYWKDKCKEGNSAGACSDYFDGLRELTKELRLMSPKCQLEFSQKNENFQIFISHGLQIMSLVAWGEKPPKGVAERLGWLTVTHMQTFCYLKRTFIEIAGDENFEALKQKVFREYPDNWPESLSIEERLPENRPRAYKTPNNMTGSLSFDEVYERSIFSIRCDLYM